MNPSFISSYSLLAALSLVALACSLASGQSCHLRELDLCAATLVVFTQSPSGLAVSDQDLNKQCGYLREADNCLKNFIKRCTTPIQRSMVSFMGEGSMDLLDDYCKPGTELRKAYLKHATCLNSAQKSHQKACIKDLQSAFETLTTISADNWQKRIPFGCCTYRRFESCIDSQVEKKCGKEALNFINMVLKRAFSRMPDMICRNYKPDGNECKAILPPVGATPKGSKSTSVISRLFSAYTAADLSRRMSTNIVPKVRSHAINRLTKRVQQKALNRSMRNDAAIFVLGNHSLAFNPCIVVNSEGNHYMFNCPPSAMRLAFMSKIKISNLENVFITNRTWDHLSGIFGISLTVQDMGVPDLQLTSTDGIESIFEVSNRFLKFSTGMQCKTRTPSDGDYVDSSIRIKPIVIDDHARIEPSGDDSDGIKRARYRSKLLVYLCTLPDLLGPLDPIKCKELKVPVGPLLGQLKSGFDVTLPDGTVIKSQDVTGPTSRGISFLVMDCSHEDIIEKLANNDQLEKARKSRLESDELQVDFVFHLCPPPVFENPAYQQWIAGFSESCKHFYVTNPDTKLINFIECYRLQYMLNQIDDKIFPLLHVESEHSRLSIEEDLLASKQKFEQSPEAALDPEVEPTLRIVGDLNQLDTVTKLRSLDKITLRPRQTLETLDASNSIDLKHKEAAVNPHYNEELERLRQLRANLPEAKDYEPELIFLGTGSAAPSKYRSSSCILMNFKYPRNASAILDCGEDSYGQFLRHYGPSKTDQILQQLDLIYVSHQHADHHIGLIQLLSKRRKLTDRPVTLIVPPQVMDLLRFYNENFEDLSMTYRVYQSKDLKTFPLVGPASISVIDLKRKLYDELKGLLDRIDVVQVDHCSHACAVVFHFNIGHPEMSKFSVAYSGDARPCEEFVIVGKNCDLLIHEATFDDRSQSDALAKRHCTSKEAIKMGKDMKAKFTLLTHFSQRLPKIPYFTDDFDDDVGFSFDNLSLRCPSHFSRLPILKPMMSLVFKESLREIDLKCLKSEQRAKGIKEALKLSPSGKNFQSAAE